MRAVVQRVSQSAVALDGEKVGSIGPGLLVLLGVAKGDAPSDAAYLAEKIANLRIFEDDNRKMNRSLMDIQGEMLVVSQFTLLGDCRKGRRPSFIQAAAPEIADRLYLQFVESVRKKGLHVETGRFQARMAVELINDGPVTLVLESPVT
jgi:D-tyrosyl-tRNA(Tyr) deacylase